MQVGIPNQSEELKNDDVQFREFEDPSQSHETGPSEAENPQQPDEVHVVKSGQNEEPRMDDYQSNETRGAQEGSTNRTCRRRSVPFDNLYSI
jgi:hypothetical protein